MIDGRRVDGRLIARLQLQLPVLLDDVPAHCRLTADSIAVSADGSLRLLRCHEGEGGIVADYGAILLESLDASSVRSARLRRLAHACVDGEIADAASLRLALERCEAGNVHTWVVAAIVVLLALLVWLNK